MNIKLFGEVNFFDIMFNRFFKDREYQQKNTLWPSIVFLCSKGAKISEDLRISACFELPFLKRFTKYQELSGIRDREGSLLSSGYHELYSYRVVL